MLKDAVKLALVLIVVTALVRLAVGAAAGKIPGGARLAAVV